MFHRTSAEVPHLQSRCQRTYFEDGDQPWLPGARGRMPLLALPLLSKVSPHATWTSSQQSGLVTTVTITEKAEMHIIFVTLLQKSHGILSDAFYSLE